MFDLDYKVSRAEFKLDDSSPSGAIIGYSAYFNNVDSYDDIILPGAFRKTISERVDAGRVMMLDSHDWTSGGVIGGMKSATEDEQGLLSTSTFSAIGKAQDIRTLVKEGFLDGLSVGIRIILWESSERIRLIKEALLWEHSITPFPANELARIVAVKSAKRGIHELPIAAPSVKFDADGAMERVLKWAGCDGLNPNNKLDKAFFSRDASKGWALDAYSGLFADVVDGKLVAIPDAIEKAREETIDNESKAVVEKYYMKMRGVHTDASAPVQKETKQAGPQTAPTYSDRLTLQRRIIEIGGAI